MNDLATHGVGKAVSHVDWRSLAYSCDRQPCDEYLERTVDTGLRRGTNTRREHVSTAWHHKPPRLGNHGRRNTARHGVAGPRCNRQLSRSLRNVHSPIDRCYERLIELDWKRP